MEQVLIFTTVVIAVVEAIKAGADRNWRTVALICGAGIAGGILGALGVVSGVGVVAGVALGLSASGVVTVAKKV
jgi:hypothetical protein